MNPISNARHVGSTCSLDTQGIGKTTESSQGVSGETGPAGKQGLSRKFWSPRYTDTRGDTGDGVTQRLSRHQGTEANTGNHQRGEFIITYGIDRIS